MRKQPAIDAALHYKFEGLFHPHRFKILYGGRGGMKTIAIARALIILSARTKLRVLCCREFQNSIRESVHQVLKDQISELGFHDHFRVFQNEIRGVNGSEFVFIGLRATVHSMRSYYGFNVAWVEEAQCISELSWISLIPTIREPGSEIWMSFNPDEESDPTYQRFVINPPKNSLVIKTGWEDNPWLPTEIRDDKDQMYATDPDRADNVYGGNPRKVSKAQILAGKWVVADFEPGDPRHGEWHGPYQGIDWGFAESPTVMTRSWITGPVKSLKRELWIEYEAYGVGIDNDELPNFFDQIPRARDYVTRSDCARPETISHMRRHGYPRVCGAAKWQGSVEDGLRHLRGYDRIVIHSRCPWTADQAKRYSYKVDAKTEDVLPVVVKKHDDCWDSVRYALEPIIQRERKSTSGYESVTKRVGSYGRRGFGRQHGSLL
jgi:phage terminase large subunit